LYVFLGLHKKVLNNSHENKLLITIVDTE